MTSNTTNFKTFDVGAQYTLSAEKNSPMPSYKMFILPQSFFDTAWSISIRTDGRVLWSLFECYC